MAGKVRRHQGGTIRQLVSGRWQVRVQDPMAGTLASVGTFASKKEAQLALAAAVTDQTRGAWVSPAAGRALVGEYVAQWIERHATLGIRTRERYRSIHRHHVAPHLGHLQLGELSTAVVRRWHQQLHLASPSTASHAYRLLRAVMNTAVEDSVIAVNPCRIKNAGVEHHPERPIATIREVEALAEAVPPRFRMLVLMAAWTSLRFGELAALTRADIDLLHGTVVVNKNRQRLDDGTSVVVKPKSKAGYRTVSIPPPLLPDLEDHLARYVGASREAVVFTGDKGSPLDRSHWREVWVGARKTIDRDDLTFHDLRHTGNTLAAATGASTRELMVRMGHSSPRAALIYQHATRERDEAIAAALGELMKNASVTSLKPRAGDTDTSTP